MAPTVPPVALDIRMLRGTKDPARLSRLAERVSGILSCWPVLRPCDRCRIFAKCSASRTKAVFCETPTWQSHECGVYWRFMASLMRNLSDRLDLASINTATLGYRLPIEQTIEAVARAGFGGISPWRREVESGDVNRIALQIRDAGLAVSGYCRSGYLPAATPQEFAANLAENCRAIEAAASPVGLLHGSSVLIPPPDRPGAAGRGGTASVGSAEVVCGGVEPLEPM